MRSTGALASDDVADWLSGLLIGREIRAARAWALRAGIDPSIVRIIGSDALAERYELALGRRGRARRARRATTPPRAACGASRARAGIVAAPVRMTALRSDAACDDLDDYLAPLPLVAVLRGITPEEIPAVADALCAEGFRILEVPLNSPQPFESIRLLAERCGDRCLVGAGTVIDPADVARVRDAGGRLIVMPHADTAVIREARRLGMVCLPGVATPTEAFAALAAGADGLKLFPAEAMVPAALRAWRAVLPKSHARVRGRRHTPGQHGAVVGRGRRGFRHRLESVQAGRRCCAGARARRRRTQPRFARCPDAMQ